MSDSISIKINDYDALINDLDYEKLDSMILSFNERSEIFEVSEDENFLLIDTTKVKQLIHLLSQQDSDIPMQVDLGQSYAMWTNGLPEIDITSKVKLKYRTIALPELGYNIDYLDVPFSNSLLKKKETEVASLIEALKKSIMEEEEKEKELRKLRNNPEALRKVLSVLHSSKRKLKLSYKLLKKIFILLYNNEEDLQKLKDLISDLDLQEGKINVRLF